MPISNSPNPGQLSEGFVRRRHILSVRFEIGETGHSRAALRSEDVSHGAEAGAQLNRHLLEQVLSRWGQVKTCHTRQHRIMCRQTKSMCRGGRRRSGAAPRCAKCAAWSSVTAAADCAAARRSDAGQQTRLRSTAHRKSRLYRSTLLPCGARQNRAED